MATKVIAGNTVVLTWTAQRLTDPMTNPPTYASYDPTTPTLRLEDPDGLITVYTYPTDPQITKSSVGAYYATLHPVTTGPWKYQWKDPDAGTPGLVEGAFTVAAPKIP